jgi:hypothetical protein
MPTAFIVRPFGKQKTRISETVIEIDFDDVEKELIDPVLTRLGVTGRTTGEIVVAGNIRDDMFELLLTRDLVVADVTIHNANVFYELGIRHALRDRKTFMIRSKGDPMPFDALTNRYFEYDHKDPGASVDRLAAAIKQTLDSEASDSPVFRSIPELRAQDVGIFMTVPARFREECELARDTKSVDDLLHLASEAKGLDWGVTGLRVVGRALLGINAMEAARDTWEEIRKQLPADQEANEQLGTIYQRLSVKATSVEERIRYLTRSDLAIRKVLSISDLPINVRAEQLLLLGRNAKSRWRYEWNDKGEGKRETALRSSWLRESFAEYSKGFDIDLNHYFSGLNAMTMLTILTILAEGLPDVWSSIHDSPKEADDELRRYREQLADLAPAVKLSLESERKRLEARDQEAGDPEEDLFWLKYGLAEFKCLTSNQPGSVAHAYREALAKAKDFHRDAAKRQLLLYQELGLLTDNARAALEVIP